MNTVPTCPFLPLFLLKRELPYRCLRPAVLALLPPSLRITLHRIWVQQPLLLHEQVTTPATLRFPADSREVRHKMELVLLWTKLAASNASHSVLVASRESQGWRQGTSPGTGPEASAAGELRSLGNWRRLCFVLWKMNMKFSCRGSGAPKRLSVLDVSAPRRGGLGSMWEPSGTLGSKS